MRQEAAPSVRVQATFYLPSELLDEARDAVAHLAGAGEDLSLNHLAEVAIREKLDELRESHTEGRPFPPRQREPLRVRRFAA